MAYAKVSDIKREFKNTLATGDVITDSKINEFILDAESVINSFIGTKYVTPVSGTLAVAQVDTITIDTAVDSTEYSASFLVNGETKTIAINSGTGATVTSIRDALVTAISGDSNAPVSASSSGADKYIVTSLVPGLAYSLAVDSNSSFVNTTANVAGSEGLRLVKKIETDLVACKVAGILKTKVAGKLEGSGVRQDIKDESCGASAMMLLKKIQKGSVNLPDATVISSGGGLQSHNSKNSIDPCFQKGVKQW